jgi:replicative DNA helicase
MTRLFCQDQNIDSSPARAGFINAATMEKVGKAASHVSGCRLYLDDNQAITPLHIRNRCRQIQAREGRELGLIIVDYFQRLKCDQRQQRDDRNFAEISDALCNIAYTFKCPLLLLSQVNRECERRPNKRPVLSDLKETGALEQDAYGVALIYRDEYYNNKTTDKGIAEVIVAKNRGGKEGTIRMAWIPQFTRFADLEEDQVSDESWDEAPKESEQQGLGYCNGHSQ